MTNIPDLLKCPGCHRKGTMDLIIRKKQAEAQCRACGEMITSRVPYPKHRVSHKNRQYPFKVPSVRPIWTCDGDNTLSQKEYQKK